MIVNNLLQRINQYKSKVLSLNNKMEVENSKFLMIYQLMRRMKKQKSWTKEASSHLM